MLSRLKQEIKQREMAEMLIESLTTKSDEIVKSAFLDDISVDVLGAENDPEIKQLVESIPEYDDHDDQLEMEILSLTESLMETEIQ
jgi:hypothetical protein